MKKIYLIKLFLLLVSGITAQNFNQIIASGDTFLGKRDYQSALKEYFAAQATDPSRTNIVRQKITFAYTKINDLRIEADNASDSIRKQIIRIDSLNKNLKVSLKNEENERERAEKAEKEAKIKAAIAEANLYSFKAKQYLNEGKFKLKIALDTATLAMKKLDSFGIYVPYVYETFGEAVYKARKKALPSNNHEVEVIQTSPKGKYILVTKANNVAILIDTTQSSKPKIIRHKKAILSAAIDSSATKILTCSADNTAQLIDLSKGTTVLFDKHSDEILGGTFSKNGNLVVTWSRDDKTLLWDIKEDTVDTLGSHKGNVYQVEFSPDESRIATRSSDLTVKLWDKVGKCINTLKHQSYIYQTKFSPDSLHIITCSADKTVKLWDMEGKPKDSLLHHTTVLSAQFNKSGDKIMTLTQDSTLTIWINNGASFNSLVLNKEGRFGTAYFLADDNYVMTAEKNQLKLWDLSARIAKEIGNHSSAIKGISFDKKYQYILSHDINGTVKLWDFNKHYLLMTLAHKGKSTPQFSPDGTYILTSSDGKRVERTPIPDIVYQQLKNNF